MLVQATMVALLSAALLGSVRGATVALLLFVGAVVVSG